MRRVRDAIAFVWPFLLLAAVVVVVVGVAMIAATTSQQARRLVEIAETNQSNGRILIHCTTPTPADAGPDDRHVCYEDAQGRTAAAVAAIVAEVDFRTCVRIEQAVASVGRPIDLHCDTEP